MNIINLDYKNLKAKLNTIDTSASKEQKLPHYHFTFIAPYALELGYSIYEPEITVNDYASGSLITPIADDLYIMFSLSPDEPNSDESIERIFVYFDMDTNTLYLKFKVLDEWRTVATVDYSENADEEKETANQILVNKYISMAKAKSEYAKLGEKFLTSAVLDSDLDRGDWNNRFVRMAFATLLKESPDQLVEILAGQIHKDYTERPVENIVEQLKAVQKEETGMMEMVAQVLGEEQTPFRYKTEQQPMNILAQRKIQESEEAVKAARKAEAEAKAKLEEQERLLKEKERAESEAKAQKEKEEQEKLEKERAELEAKAQKEKEEQEKQEKAKATQQENKAKENKEKHSQSSEQTKDAKDKKPKVKGKDVFKEAQAKQESVPELSKGPDGATSLDEFLDF